MVRNYKPNPRAKTYVKHSSETIKKALVDHEKGMSFWNSSRKHAVPIAVMCRRYQNPNMKTHAGQTAPSKELEKYMAEKIAVCAMWGYPLDNFDVRYFVKGDLDKRGIGINCFKNNMLSKEWVESFVKANSDLLSHRICQNINPFRASVSPEIVEKFFVNFAQNIEGVPSQNMLNYDQTNLSDDPRKKKVIMKKGTK